MKVDHAAISLSWHETAEDERGAFEVDGGASGFVKNCATCLAG